MTSQRHQFWFLEILPMIFRSLENFDKAATQHGKQTSKPDLGRFFHISPRAKLLQRYCGDKRNATLFSRLSVLISSYFCQNGALLCVKNHLIPIALCSFLRLWANLWQQQCETVFCAQMLKALEGILFLWFFLCYGHITLARCKYFACPELLMIRRFAKSWNMAIVKKTLSLILYVGNFGF